MRRAFNDALMSAGAVMILLLVLVALDDGVRAQVWRRAATPSVELGSVTQQVSHFTQVTYKAARDQSLAHAPMVVFSVAAGILVLFMLRT
jgi:hypothetical protein